MRNCLRLSNNPKDGNFRVRIGRSLLLSDGKEIFAGLNDVGFDGLAIESPSLKQREACINDLNQKGRHDLGPVFLTPKDLWGPYSREKAYARVKTALEGISINENWSESKFNNKVTQIREKLKLGN